MTKYYRTVDNKYVGGFDGALPPAGSIEVPFPPKDARSLWNGSDWDVPVVSKEEAVKVELVKQGYTIEERLSAIEAYLLKNDKAAAEEIQAIKDSIDAAVIP